MLPFLIYSLYHVCSHGYGCIWNNCFKKIALWSTAGLEWSLRTSWNTHLSTILSATCSLWKSKCPDLLSFMMHSLYSACSHGYSYIWNNCFKKIVLYISKMIYNNLQGGVFLYHIHCRMSIKIQELMAVAKNARNINCLIIGNWHN